MNMNRRLEGKVAVVTGAGRGVGRAYAHALAAEGARVVVNDLGANVDGQDGQPVPADQVVAEIEQAGGSAVANYDSVAEFDAAGRIMEAAIQAFGRMDILVANAGIIRPKYLYEAYPADWTDVLGVHANGTFFCARQAIPHIASQGAGTIITTGDITQDLYYPRIGAYRAAKAAIVVLTIHLAHELREFGINVNAVMPGATATRMAERFFTSLEDKIDSFLDDVKAKDQPASGELAPPAAPETVPPLGVYLCTDEGHGITGRQFRMNGTRIGVVTTLAETSFLETDAENWTTDALVERVPAWLEGVPSYVE
jgi:NAD(P)-dependent dehydrogenase (short-subunit alcohol dehydrogenase family)